MRKETGGKKMELSKLWPVYLGLALAIAITNHLIRQKRRFKEIEEMLKGAREVK
jgi:hypothetical protein